MRSEVRPSGTSKPVQILLVEDNPDDVVIAVRALARCSVANDLHVARDGQEALEFILRRGVYGPDTPRPDLILLDINLPRVNGVEVLSRIRANAETSVTPIVMLTASSRPEDITMSYRLGANTYIQKPVEFDNFLEVIDVLVQYWARIATPPGPVVERGHRTEAAAPATR